MQQPSSNIVDALSGEEVCPLCFDRFSDADACSCVVCRVSSCPSCAEVLDADGAVRCFACRPAVQVAARVRAETPLSLPRPIALPNAARAYTPGYGAASLPPLPFPLTTSPFGVRRITRKPPGSVFIGLPAVSEQLAQSLQAQAREPRLEAKARLPRRPLQKLALLSHVLTGVAALYAFGQRSLAFARSDEVRAWFAQVRARMELGWAASRRALRAGAALAQREGRLLATWFEQSVEPRMRALLLRLEPRARALYARITRHSLRAKPAVRVDPSRPIHL